MQNNKVRAIRIGIAVNTAEGKNAGFIEDQYKTSDEVFNEIAAVLRQHGAEVIKIEAESDLFGKLSELVDQIDLVFNLAEDIYQVALPMAVRQVQLEHHSMHPACTGSSVDGHVLALDKALARRVLGDWIAQPQWWSLENLERITIDSDSFPVIIKPVSEGHSLGVHQENVVHSMPELEAALERLRKRFKGKMLIESFLDGMEYSMGLVGEVIMPAVAWNLHDLPGQPLVRGEELKQQDMTIPHATLVKDTDLLETLATQVATAHIGLGLYDYSRSDFRASANASTPCYLETNSMPGLQNLQSVLPWSAANAGVSYEELIGSIVAQAIKRLPADYLQQLDTEKFEAAYQQLKNRSTRQITVRGRTFHILEPRQQNTADQLETELQTVAS